MFLKVVDGPRAVRLSDGTHLSRGDLPPAGLVRWTARRKATVARAVVHGLITRPGAIDMWGLSEEELEGWLAGLERGGERALRATRRPA